MDNQFIEAIPILERLMDEGFEAYFVGGSVRDSLLGRDIHDVDIATSATPVEIMDIFPHHVPVGIEHGTILVIQNGISYEITTFRTESEYEDFRRPSEVQFVRSLKEDIKRRDFTINAMAMTTNGEIVDLYHGRDDLEQKIIRTVRDPDERFTEDALRMMRGIRFVSQLGFTLEEQTKKSIMSHASILENISVERITSEFEKLLVGRYFVDCIPILAESNLIPYLPQMEKYQEKVSECSKFEFAKLLSLQETWALFLLILGVDDVWEFLKGWKLPRKQIITIQTIVDAVKKQREWTSYEVYHHGIDTSISIERVHSIYTGQMNRSELVKDIFSKLSIHHRNDICINGKDLMDWCNRKPGSWIGEYIEQIEKEIVDKTLPNAKMDIREVVLSWEK